MATKQSEKKTIPGFSQGVRRNAAIRTIKMVQPICPNSKVDMLRGPDGKPYRNPEPDPNRRSCQEERDENGNSIIGWWRKCEELGHNPYFTTRVWFSEEDEYDEAGEYTGTKKKRHTSVYPNVTQVAAHTRVNSGRGPLIKMRASGFKRLADIGYEEVCQFRSCQKPVTVVSAVGEFCGNDHAYLCAADFYGILDYQRPRDERWVENIETGIDRKERQFLAEASVMAQARPKK